MDLNMNTLLSSKKLLLFFMIINTFLTFTIGYYPFCKFDSIESDYFPAANFNEFVIGCRDRAKIYRELMFITKGMSLEAPYKNGDMVVLYLGWDGNIHIKQGETKKKIIIEKVKKTYWDNSIINDTTHVIERFPDKDSVYTVVRFRDVQNNIVSIYEQPDNLPFGGKKNGFKVEMDNWCYSSGNKNYFDY